MARSTIIIGAWDLAVYGSVSVTLTDDGGVFPLTPVSTGVLDHDNLLDDCGMTASTTSYLGAVFEAMLNGASSDAYTVTFSRVTGLYTITDVTPAAGPFKLTWTGAAGLRLRNLLGFQADLLGATSYTSTHVPLYCIVPFGGAMANYPGPVQEKGHRSSIRSSAGQAYRNGPLTIPELASFDFEFQPRSHVDRLFRIATSATHLYGWDELWDDYSDCLLPLALQTVGADGKIERFAFDLATPEFDETTHKPRAKNDHVRWTVSVAALLRQSEASPLEVARTFS
jgi:hypothetical protein